jgi:tryprostatin B 6-hydroxylase
MLNLRTTVARLVMTFDMTFPTNEDETRWMEAADDHFAMGIEHMPVILTKRG